MEGLIALGWIILGIYALVLLVVTAVVIAEGGLPDQIDENVTIRDLLVCIFFLNLAFILTYIIIFFKKYVFTSNPFSCIKKTFSLILDYQPFKKKSKQ